jgi:hypothetical protein
MPCDKRLNFKSLDVCRRINPGFSGAPEMFSEAPEMFADAPEMFADAPEMFADAPEMFAAPGNVSGARKCLRARKCSPGSGNVCRRRGVFPAVPNAIDRYDRNKFLVEIHAPSGAVDSA